MDVVFNYQSPCEGLITMDGTFVLPATCSLDTVIAQGTIGAWGGFVWKGSRLWDSPCRGGLAGWLVQLPKACSAAACRQGGTATTLPAAPLPVSDTTTDVQPPALPRPPPTPPAMQAMSPP